MSCGTSRGTEFFVAFGKSPARIRISSRGREIQQARRAFPTVARGCHIFIQDPFDGGGPCLGQDGALVVQWFQQVGLCDIQGSASQDFLQLLHVPF